MFKKFHLKFLYPELMLRLNICQALKALMKQIFLGLQNKCHFHSLTVNLSFFCSLCLIQILKKNMTGKTKTHCLLF